MLEAIESGLKFNFKVKAYNYDDSDSIYEKNRFCGNSAVDFLMLYKRSIFFMEVKNANYFQVEVDILSDKICKIYKNFIDSIALVSMSDDKDLQPFKTRLKNGTAKMILFISDKLPADIKMIYYEKIKKQLNKKLKRLNRDIEFMLSTQDDYNDKLYSIKDLKNEIW